MKISENYSLNRLNTFGLESIARFFTEVSNDQELLEAVDYANNNNLTVFVLGGGSNVVLGPEIPGLTIHNMIKGLAINEDGSVVVGGGENWDDVVWAAVDKNMAGIECLTGVPGSAGGAVVQNIGCYGQTLQDSIESVKVYNFKSGKIQEFSKADAKFDYRSSIFKNNPGYFVMEFRLKLTPGGLPTLKYADLVEYFKDNQQPSLSEVRKALFEIRARKGMVIVPQYPSFKSAGSFFKNPIVEKETYSKIAPLISEDSQKPWFWELPDGQVKISAAKLISMAGFDKGYVDSGVGISPKQPLAIINLGNGTADQIKSLADRIKKSVNEKFGVDLQEEVLFVGKSP